MGEEEFFKAIQYICLNKEQLIQDESLLSVLTNFQVLMKVLEQSEDRSKKTSIIALLNMIFPKYRAIMTNNSIIFTIPGDTTTQPILVDENNFEILQNALRQILCVNNLFQGQNIVYNPKGKKAKAIAEKIMKGRQRVAEIKAKQGGSSIFVRYISILVVALQSMSLEACLNLNMFQLFDLMERYEAFVTWDIDLRVRLAGGKPDKPVDNWMKDLYNDN